MIFQFDVQYFNEILLLVRNHATALTFFSVALFVFLKDKRGLRYAALCAAFYVLGRFTYPLLMEFDYQIYIYRYIYWAFSDIVFMGILAYWALKDKVYLWQSVIGQIIVLPAPLLQLFRLVDRQFLDVSYSTYLYKTILPLVNIATVLLCFAPLFLLLKRKRALQVNSSQN